jgi:hypothetical protein
MSNRKTRKISTFDKSLSPSEVEQEKHKNTTLGHALKKADKLEQQNKQ